MKTNIINKPVLVVMAAGMGSRYGGIKQMDSIDDQGRFILDYSVDDAIRAGFEEAIFIIRPEMEKLFLETIGKRIQGRIRYSFAHQRLDDIPKGYRLPEGRSKPWGTGHAVLAARNAVGNRSFIVINADDYYGGKAYKLMFEFMINNDIYADTPTYAFVAYNIENTVTESGTVSRGICEADRSGYLIKITEQTQIKKKPNGAAYTNDGGASWIDIRAGTPVSMNFWGFTPDFFGELDRRFEKFLDRTLRENPLNGEYFLPFVVDEVCAEKKARVKMLFTSDNWYGVTYKEDKPALVEFLKKLKQEPIPY